MSNNHDYRAQYIDEEDCEFIRHIRTAHTFDKVYVKELKGRITAPDLLLEARDKSYETHITLRPHESGGHVWEIRHSHFTDDEDEWGDFHILLKDLAGEVLSQWWAAVAEAYAEHYVDEHIIPSSKGEDSMVENCITFNQSFFKRGQGDDAELVRLVGLTLTLTKA